MNKIAVFVDVQNIYYTCRQAYSASFDYNKFWAEITAGREIVTAIAYASLSSRKNNKQATEKKMEKKKECQKHCIFS